MAIATLTKVELVAPRASVPGLLQSLEQAALLHVDDVHEGISDELAQWEQREPVDTSPVDGTLASVRWILDLFQRFAPHKTGMLEDFFGSPPAVGDAEFEQLVASVDVHAYRAELERRLAEFEAVESDLAALRERIARVTPWERLGVDLADVARSGFAALTAVRVPAAAVAELERLLAERGGHLRLAPVSEAAKSAYAIVVSLPADVDAVGVALRQVRGEEVELPKLPASAAEALQAAQQQSVELEQRRDRLAAALAAEAHERRRALQAIADEYENRRAGLDARSRIFYSRHAAVVGGWVEETRRPALEELLAVHHPQVRYRLSEPGAEDRPPVKLENGSLARPFQTLISMYGMPNYFGVDPTPFVAVAMTVFYAIALGDFGYGMLQILLAAWLRKRFRSVGDTRLFLTMFVYMGVATLVVGVLTWSFFGFSPGATEGSKFLGFLPLVNPTKDIIPLIGISVGIGIVFQLASITAGFVNLLKCGDRTSAICDNLAWLALLIGGLLALGGVFLSQPALTGAGVVLAAAGALVIVFFAGRDSKNFVARILAGVVSLYGIVGYYGLVGFFSDGLSYMRLAILNMTSAFIAFVAQVIGGLFLGGGNSVVMVVIAAVIGGVIFVFFHLLNLVLSMLGAFVHSLRLNYLESFQRYYPEGGRAFSPFRRTGRFFRRVDE